MKDIEEIATFIRDHIRDLPNHYDNNYDEVGELDSESQDLLHAVEFGRFGTVQGFNLLKELKETRQKRRKLKNENELLYPLVNALRKMNDHLPELDRAIGDIRNAKNKHRTRTYKCRVRNDLQEVMPIGEIHAKEL